MRLRGVAEADCPECVFIIVTKTQQGGQMKFWLEHKETVATTVLFYASVITVILLKIIIYIPLQRIDHVIMKKNTN